MNLKLVIILLLLSCFSCKNRYRQWQTFYFDLENNPAIGSENVETPIPHLQEVIYFFNDYTSYNPENIQNPNIERYYQSYKFYVRDFYTDCINTLDNNLNSKINNKNSIEDLILYLESLLLAGDAHYAAFHFSKIDSIIEEGIKVIDYLPVGLYHYFLSRFLLLEAKIQSSKQMNINAISTIHYALNQLSTSEYPYQKTTLNLLKLKFKILTNESSNYSDYLDQLYDIMMYDYEHLHDINQKTNLICDYASYLAFQGQPDKADSLFKTVDINDDRLKAKTKSYFFISKAFLYRVKDPELSLLFVDQAAGLITDSICVQNFYVNRLYKADALITLDRLDEAKRIIDRNKCHISCDSFMTKNIEFYNNTMLGSFYRKWRLKNTLDTEIYLAPFLENRKLAKMLYKDDQELHLDDYYVDNTIAVLDILKNAYNNKIPIKFHHLILELMHETRFKEIKRKSLLSLKDSSSFQDPKLDSLNFVIKDNLRRCADFSKLNDYDSSYYATLYHTFKIKENYIHNISLDEKQIRETNLRFVDVKQVLRSEDARLIEMINNENQYYFVSYDGRKMMIYDYNKSTTDSLIKIYYNRYSTDIYEDKNVTDANFMHLSPFDNEYNYSMNYLLTDGLFSNISFDLILNKFTLIHDANQLNDLNNVFLDSKSVCVLSFSDSLTRRNLNPSEIEELYFDFEECKHIISVLEVSPDNHIHGRNATFNSLQNFKNVDIWHLATHSSNVPSERFNNFLYLRNPDGTAAKIYIPELYKMSQTPKFVCLSSCKSGIGTQIVGQGIYSVSRPFFSGGTLTVIKSLWNVDDHATRTFFPLFYQHWKSGMSVSQALFQTKIDFKKSSKYAHPYYWSGFVLEGNPNLYLQ